MRGQVSLENRDRFITLGVVIAAVRKRRGLSQEQLAERARISRTELSEIEASGIVCSFSLDILYRIADGLEVKAGDLLNTELPS